MEDNSSYFRKFRTELILVLAVVVVTLVGGVTLIIREGAIFHAADKPAAPAAAMPHAKASRQ